MSADRRRSRQGVSRSPRRLSRYSRSENGTVPLHATSGLRKRRFLIEPLEPRTSPSSSFAGLVGLAGAAGAFDDWIGSVEDRFITPVSDFEAAVLGPAVPAADETLSERPFVEMFTPSTVTSESDTLRVPSAPTPALTPDTLDYLLAHPRAGTPRLLPERGLPDSLAASLPQRPAGFRESDFARLGALSAALPRATAPASPAPTYHAASAPGDSGAPAPRSHGQIEPLDLSTSAATAAAFAARYPGRPGGGIRPMSGGGELYAEEDDVNAGLYSGGAVFADLDAQPVRVVNPEGQWSAYNLLANDTGAVNVTWIDWEVEGTYPSGGGDPVINFHTQGSCFTGTFDLKPAAGFHGEYTLRYCFTTDSGTSNWAAFYVEVLPLGLDIETAFDGTIPSGGSGGGPEDYEELSPGNIIRYNDDDEDGDGTLDYADEDPLQAPDTALEKITVRWNDLGVVLKDFTLSFAQSVNGTPVQGEDRPLKVWDTAKKEHKLTDAVFTLNDSGGATSSVAGVGPLSASGNEFYVEGRLIGAPHLAWVLNYPAALGGTPVGSDKVKVTVVKIDIDADSDNDGDVDRSAAEDSKEDVPGDGVGQVGKRIFVNLDDDNKNGKIDVSDAKSDYLLHDLHDKDFAQIVLEASGVSGLEGFSLWLGADAGLKVFADDQKTLLCDLPQATRPNDGVNLPWEPGYDAGMDTWYIWDIDSEGVTFPGTLYAEARQLGEKEVFWRLVGPDGSGSADTGVAARDTVEINAEEIVWPNQDPTALANWNSDENTSTWTGFALKNYGWFISSSLCQIINGTYGYIRTQYPEEKEYPGQDPPAHWEGTSSENNRNAGLDLAELCGTETWGEGVTIRIEVAYEFEQSPNISVGQFVDTDHDHQWKEGFFHNSGVKIENRAEIQIYDTASLLDAITNGHHATIDGKTTVGDDPLTISADPNWNIEQTHQVLLQHTGSQSGQWTAENVNALISGIPYNVTPKPLGITYMQWLQGAPMGGHTMIIDVAKDGNGEYDFTVTVVGHSSEVGYHVVGSGTSDPGMLYLQSHWGGGVKFTSAKVKKL